MDLITYLSVVGVFAFIPAMIAGNRGHSFGKWWLYGAAVPVVAVAHAFVVSPKARVVASVAPPQPAAAGVAVSTAPEVLSVAAAANDLSGAVGLLIPLVLNLLVFLVMAVTYGTTHFSAPQAAAAGADYAPLTLGNGEVWRLLTSTYIQFSPSHIAGNMGALLVFGRPVARRYGWRKFLVFYTLCGLGGNIVSVFTHPDVVCAGASGAIAGLFGALFIFRFMENDTGINPQYLWGLLLYNVVFAMLKTDIDWQAHVGGIVTGLGLAFVLHQMAQAAPSHVLAGELPQVPRTSVPQVSPPQVRPPEASPAQVSAPRAAVPQARLQQARLPRSRAAQTRMTVFAAIGISVVILVGVGAISDDSDDSAPDAMGQGANHQFDCAQVTTSDVLSMKFPLYARLGIQPADASVPKINDAGQCVSTVDFDNGAQITFSLDGHMGVDGTSWFMTADPIDER